MLGSREGIARANVLCRSAGRRVAVVNADEPLLEPYWRELDCRVITFGFSNKAVIRPAAGGKGIKYSLSRPVILPAGYAAAAGSS